MRDEYQARHLITIPRSSAYKVTRFLKRPMDRLLFEPCARCLVRNGRDDARACSDKNAPRAPMSLALVLYRHAQHGGVPQITVMFCALVASTAMAVRMDPEDLHDIIGDNKRLPG